MGQVLTSGIDHVGLTVSTLSASVAFFVDGLGWSEKGGKPEYPAAFVSDGRTLLTLWQVADPGRSKALDRKTNIGLHHLALRVDSSEALETAFARIANWPDVQVEFAPEFSGQGPKRHFMILEPGGNRIEFAWDPRQS